MRVSVLVPTYRRPASLERCLSALVAQETHADEILVVARRDDGASRQVIDTHANECIRAVLVDVAPGRPGLVAAMNAGLRASKGRFVCLTDDDAEPHPDWITRIVSTFARDPSIGAVGGRDRVHHDGQLDAGAESVVGTLTWYGRLVGNHHLGVGAPRNVDVLKGVNLSVRGDLLRKIGFDTRLRGTSTEHHWEVALCLTLRRLGHRVIYDPAIAVEHYPQPRVDEAREFRPHQVRDAAHNETLALLEHLGGSGRVAHLLVSTAIGTREAPGVARAVRGLVGGGTPRFCHVAGNLGGRFLGTASYLRSR